MNRKKQILFSLLLAAGLIGLIGFARPAGAQETQTRVVAVKKDIPSGKIIESEDLETIDIPQRLFNEAHFSEIEPAIGLVSSYGLPAGEWLRKDRIGTSPEGMKHLPDGEGRRLLTLALPPEAVNGYWLTAGNRVDIDIIPRSKTDQWLPESIEHVEVVAVITRRTGPDLQNYPAGSDIATPMVCLAVTRDQAIRLAAAAVHDEIRLSVVCR